MPAEWPPSPHSDDADGALVSSAHTAALLLQSSNEIRTVGRGWGVGSAVERKQNINLSRDAASWLQQS